ncbi:hypothetical protein [Pedobacter punctiformis]|uniref:Uncharacterized protein n=1 Tax=Pedobacter punctiformis TaxID=3004097 RepID=A0ABT4L886_9SPHI|nr:hypothetical protein [Pedobacter sp. HCMS5-2]MCZ4244134.1 hypothetical protein [Pedobacter sp. HCMS5-2]
MNVLKIFYVLLIVFFVTGLLLFLVFVLPEYMACNKTMYEGEKGITFFGDEIDCGCENQAFGEALTQLFATILISLSLIIITLKLIMNKLKNKLISKNVL